MSTQIEFLVLGLLSHPPISISPSIDLSSTPHKSVSASWIQLAQPQQS
uniref:Uncharacterized protein n=1 Tax=Arundo donax TaxID=35708 RepID=A0A0A9C0K0_ARUDO